MAKQEIIHAANLVVATLKTAYHIHQHNHWTTSGANFYSNHLLFQRLYESALEDLDACAEKMVGYFGVDAVSFPLQAELCHKLMLQYWDVKGVDLSIAIEKDLVALISETRTKIFIPGIEGSCLGLDNMLNDVSDHRDEALYLLKQVRGEATV